MWLSDEEYRELVYYKLVYRAIGFGLMSILALFTAGIRHKFFGFSWDVLLLVFLSGFTFANFLDDTSRAIYIIWKKKVV